MEDSSSLRESDRSGSPEGNLATTIALELVKEAGYIRQPVAENSSALALRSGSFLLLLLPCQTLDESEVSTDLTAWYRKLKAKELPGITTIDLLYCLATPSAHLKSVRKRRKAAFVGGHSVRVDFVDTSDVPKTLGSLDKNLTKAVQRGQESYSAGRIASAEDLREAVARSVVSHGEFASRLASVTPLASYAVLATCLVLFGWGSLIGGTEDTLTLLRFGANYAPLTSGQGEWWRLYGSTFLHIGVVHLACNMLALLTVGVRAEQVYGTLKYLALYSLAGFCGALASVSTGQSVSAGASGALFGVFGAIVVLGWRFHAEWPAAYRQRLFKGMAPMIAYNLIYGFSNAGIDNAAHLGGLLAGCLFALAVRPQALQNKAPAPTLRFAMLAVGLVPFLCLGWVVHSVMVTSGGLDAYPQKEYRDVSGDLSVRLPALFVPKSENGEDFLAGPGMIVVLKKLDEINTVAIDSPLFLEGIQQAPGTVATSTEHHDGRTWVLRDGTEGEALVRQGFVNFGAMCVKVEVDVAKTQGEQGDQLRLLAMETLARKSYDRKVNGQVLAQQGLHTRALEELSTLDDSLEISLLRVDSLRALARYKDAENILDQVASKNPQNAEIARARWDLFHAMRDHSRALPASVEAARLETDAAEKNHLLAHQADHLERLGRTQEADELFRKVRKADEKEKRLERELLGFAAWNAVLDGHYKESLPLVERSLKVQETSSNLDTRGRAYLELGEYQKAKADYEKILNEDINTPFANYAWARIAQEEGDAETARTFYIRYIDLAGADNEFGKDALERANQLQP